MLISCSRRNDSGNDIMDIATIFAIQELDSATTFTDPNGVVSIGDSLIRYVIDPKQIFEGALTDRNARNILITVDSLHDPYLVPAYHLVLNNEMETVAIIRSDMRVLAIENGLITAEIPTHAPSSPLYYCDECRDTVKYKLVRGELILNNPVLK